MLGLTQIPAMEISLIWLIVISDPVNVGSTQALRKTLFPWHISWPLLFTSIETELKFQFDFSSFTFKAVKITSIQCTSNHHVGWFVMYTEGFEFLMRKLKKNGPDFTTPFLPSLSVNNFRKALSIFSPLLLYNNSLYKFFLHFNFSTLFVFLFYPFSCKDHHTITFAYC